MGAHVVERAELAVPIANDEHRFTDDVADQVVAWPRDLLGATDAHPAPEEETLALFFVDAGARVVRAGQGRPGSPACLVADAWTLGRALPGDHLRLSRIS